MRNRRPRSNRKLKPSSAPAAGAGLTLPFVAIVGRPNVGKSTLFNRLMGRRISIVEPTAGTTRDRVSALLDLPSGERVELCDMGGLGGTEDPLDKDVDRQIRLALELADAIIFVADVRDGLVPLDQDIARRLMKLDVPIILVANKAETRELEALSGELHALGIGDPIPMSAREGTGRSDLMKALDAVFTPEEDEPEEAEEPREAKEVRVAVVGRRNAGKSSYVNALFGADRVIVSPRPGTTRDAVDVRCLVDGEPIVLIDTAGLRKRGKADDAIELISHGRAREAIRRADVAIAVFDVLRDISEVDKKIVELVVSENKPVVLVGNKWDLVKDSMSPDQYADYMRKKIPTAHFAPVAMISCTSLWNIKAPVELARDLYAQSLVRVTTGELNRVIHEAFARRRPRKKRHVDAKIYFGTQIRTNPVTIVLFVNKPMLFDAEYQRYLSTELRAALPWSEIPIKLVIRERIGLIERGLTRSERDDRKAARALEKSAAFMRDDAPPAPAEVLAEFDTEEVRAALSAELDAEEAAAAVKIASSSLGGAKSSLAAPAPVNLEDDNPDDAVSLDDEPREGERPRRDELLYGEDANMIKFRRERHRARRGRGQSGGKKPEAK